MRLLSFDEAEFQPLREHSGTNLSEQEIARVEILLHQKYEHLLCVYYVLFYIGYIHVMFKFKFQFQRFLFWQVINSLTTFKISHI
jgi:hypothetical protein